MKKLVVLAVMLLMVASVFADFTWTKVNLYQGLNVANGWGDTSNNMYLEIEGGGSTGNLDLYYFFDVNHFMGIGEDAVGMQGDYFTIIDPRFKLGKGLYISGKYKGWNGGANYYAGLGVNAAVPLVDMFQIDFYAMTQHVDKNAKETEFKYAGMVLALVWNTNLFKFSDNVNVYYGGWSDIGFANKYADDFGTPNTQDEFIMFNQFGLNYNKWAVSFTVELHRHFMYSEAQFGNPDATSYYLGLHRNF